MENGVELLHTNYKYIILYHILFLTSLSPGSDQKKQFKRSGPGRALFSSWLHTSSWIGMHKKVQFSIIAAHISPFLALFLLPTTSVSLLFMQEILLCESSYSVSFVFHFGVIFWCASLFYILIQFCLSCVLLLFFGQPKIQDNDN